MIEIAGIEWKEIVPGYKGRFIHLNNMTIAFWDVAAGAVMPIHHHIHEQSSQVIDGSFQLTVDGERHLLQPGFIVAIPSGITHWGVALTDCKLLDIFSPARDDYK